MIPSTKQFAFIDRDDENEFLILGEGLPFNFITSDWNEINEVNKRLANNEWVCNP